MAEQDPNQGNPAPLRELSEQAASSFFEPLRLTRLFKGIVNAGTELVTIVIAFLLESAGSIAAELADILANSENRASPAFSKLAAVAVKDLFGVEVSESDLRAGNQAGRKRASNAIGAAVLDAISGRQGGIGSGGQIEPSSKAAEDYLSFVVGMHLEGWLEGVLCELLSFGQVEAIGELDDSLAASLGLGRITAQIVRPLLRARVITPMTFLVNKAYRPELLSAALAVRQFHRGRWTREQMDEELARQGWSADRIEALVNDSTKFLSETDVLHLRFENTFDDDAAIAYLKNFGYSQETASALLNVERSKRYAAIERRLASQAVDAYARRDIDRGQLDAILRLRVNNDIERELLADEAEFNRQFSRKRLSLSDMENAVKRGIRSVRDYRELARDLGYDEADVLTLELLIQAEIQGQREAQKAKDDQAAAAAAEKARKLAADLERKRQLELERSRTLPSLAQVERAVVRGILPIARYEQQLRDEHYQAADIGFLVELVAQAREQYLEAAEKRAAAEARAAQQQLQLSTLERAVERGVLTMDDYAAQLRARNFDDDQIRVLTTLLQDRLDDLEADRRRRAELEAAAAERGISLGDLARAVRRGIRTIADYERALVDAGFPPSDTATLIALLDDELARDAEARATKAAAIAAAGAKGATLEQLARAVKLGVRTRDDYQAALVDARLTSEAQLVLLDLLDAEVAAADRARALRAGDDGAAPAKLLPLSQVEAAVKAGVRTVNEYIAAAIENGYREADIELLVDLLVAELQEKATKAQG